MKSPHTSVEAYIASFPEEVQHRLRLIRNIILTHAPDAKESISYGMPAYKVQNKPLVYFGGYPRHIGFYATPTGHAAFKERLAGYKQGKGSVQFPIDQPLPEELIAAMVQFRVTECQASAK